MEALTDQQQRVLEVVEEHIDRTGIPPTLREIGEAVGLANVNAVRGHVTALEKKGYIAKEPDKARSIRVVRPVSALSRLKKKLHEVLGTDEGVYHRLVYGLAWATRGREPWFDERRRSWVDGAIEREAAEHGWRVLDKSIEPDHVVLVVETWPNHSPQLAVRRFQAAIRGARRRAKDAIPGRELWGRGYVATTDIGLLDELVGKLLAQERKGGGQNR